MTVKDILTEYLKEHGYDGLCNLDLECGCGVKDLFMCQCPTDECEPAYRWVCDYENINNCDYFDPSNLYGGDCWCMKTDKQECKDAGQKED
jgi:hypothetical protein